MQASDHCDIESPEYLYFSNSLEGKPEAVSLFDYWSNIAQGVQQYYLGPSFLVAAIETVRSFLAQCVTDAAQEAIGEPAMPDECFEFDLPKDVCDIDRCDIYYHMLIWVCQQALQKEFSRTWSEHSKLPSSDVLIMLFLLGIPGVDVDDDYDKQVVSEESDNSLRERM